MAARKHTAPSPTIRVTSELIEHSARKNSSHCMVAQAVRDAVPAATSIAVDIQTIRFSLPERRLRYTYLTPRQAQLSIIDFDQGIMPPAFEFRLSGGHVTTMYRRVVVDTPRARLSDARKAAIAKAHEFNSHHAIGQARREKHVPDHPELAGRTKLARGGDSHLPVPVGGRPPPKVAPGLRRAFGLRALQR